MTWEEARRMVEAGHWLGAHTRTHARLSDCDDAARRDEIAGAVVAIRARFGEEMVPFAFPYGQAEDFGPRDVELLRELRTPLALTGIPGVNRPPFDPLRLRRNCVGMYHRRLGFVAEMLGLRDRYRGTSTQVGNLCHGRNLLPQEEFVATGGNVPRE
jgi:peptidoglycan/xylan/chitin deacetylase (PgdA/CDA1 family)